MTHKNNNWLHYLLVFALILLPMQNGMAAMSSIASPPVAEKQVCHEMMEHSQHLADAGNKMYMQQGHSMNCCDNDMKCHQQCSHCAHCPAVSVILHDVYKLHAQSAQDLYSITNQLPDTVLTSAQFRPPRA